MEGEERGLSTRVVHGGGGGDPHGALHTPLYDHTTFGFADTASSLAVVEGREVGSLYTRYGSNPTLESVEEQLADLDGGGAGLVFGSGMAAISASLLAHLRAGDHVVCVGDVYGGTYELLTEQLPALDVATTFLLADEADRVVDVADERTRVVYLETPTNPTLQVLDIAHVARLADRVGALLVVDNTFATPVNQRPLEHGADIAVQSATKYLGGHSDLTGGVAVGASEVLGPVKAWRTALGQVMAPQVAHQLARSLRTLVVRVRRQNETASTIARWLAGHPRVQRVHHPSVHEGPAGDLVARQMDGPGGLLSFVVDGGTTAATAVVDRLGLVAIAPSLGGVESLATQPVMTSHHGMASAERERRGIVGGMIRLSCGLEDVEDLIADLDQALAPSR